jgi:nitrogen fixation NifU-like protein
VQQNTLYKQEILDHYKNPKNFNHLKNATLTVEEKNLSCGDEIHLEILLKDDKIDEIGFLGTGCAISIATASILYNKVKGKNKADVLKMTSNDVLELIGMEKESGRIKCALLCWEALKKVLA